MKSDTLYKAMGAVREEYVRSAAVLLGYEKEEQSMQRIEEKKRKTNSRRLLSAVLAAALIVVLGITAYAVAGLFRSTGKNPMPNTADYSSLSQLPAVEKAVGFPVTVPEEFSDGSRFAGMRVEGEAVFGEENEVLEEFYALRVTYEKPGGGELYLELSPVPALPGGAEAPEPTELRIIRDVEVRLDLDRYKLVPEGYEKTPEDREREEAGHYFLTYGPEEITERDYAFAGFELEGVRYVLTDLDPSSDALEALAQMAGEVILAAKG